MKIYKMSLFSFENSRETHECSIMVSKRGVVDLHDYWYNKQWCMFDTYAVFPLDIPDAAASFPIQMQPRIRSAEL